MRITTAVYLLIRKYLEGDESIDGKMIEDALYKIFVVDELESLEQHLQSIIDAVSKFVTIEGGPPWIVTSKVSKPAVPSNLGSAAIGGKIKE